MTRRARLLSALLLMLGAVALLISFLAWRQGGLTLLQLDLGLC